MTKFEQACIAYQVSLDSAYEIAVRVYAEDSGRASMEATQAYAETVPMREALKAYLKPDDAENIERLARSVFSAHGVWHRADGNSEQAATFIHELHDFLSQLRSTDHQDRR